MPPKGAYAFEGVNANLLHEVHVTFTGILMNDLGQNPRWTNTLKVTTDLPTKGNNAKVKMASRAYGVHEWKDERQKAKIEHFDKEIFVKRWANAISLKYDDLEDEDLNLGLYRPLISEMSDDFVEHRHSLLIDLIRRGFAGTLGLAYDGQFFFDTDHTYTDTNGVQQTQSNKGTGVFNAANMYVAIKQMELMRKQNGLIANIVPTHIIAPVALRSAVEAVLDQQKNSNGSDNTLYKRVLPVFDPRLDEVSTTAWFLLDGSKALKPFYQVNRKEVETQMDTTLLFEEGIVSWGAYGRYNYDYAAYQTMYGSDGTV